MAITSAYRHRLFDSGLTALHPLRTFIPTWPMALVDPKWSYTGGLDARGSFTSAATMGRHFDGLVSTLSGYPCSLADAQQLWIGHGSAWHPNLLTTGTSGPGEPGGNMATILTLARCTADHASA